MLWLNKKFAILVLLIGILLPDAKTGAIAQAPVIVIPETPPIEAPAPDPLDAWIEKLAIKESDNRENIKILDVNGQYSYSCLQFQMPTFRAFFPLLDPLDRSKLSSTGWEKRIMSCDTQKKIAKAMIKSNPNAWRHWWTSVKKRGLGLPPVP